MLDTDTEKLILKARSEEGIVFEVDGTKFSLDFNSITKHTINLMQDYYTLDDPIITKIPKMVDVYTYKSASEIVRLLEEKEFTYNSIKGFYMKLEVESPVYCLPIQYIHAVAGVKIFQKPALINPSNYNISHVPFCPVPEWMYTVSQEEELTTTK